MWAVGRALAVGVCLAAVAAAPAQEAVGARVYRQALTATVLVMWEKDHGAGWVVDRDKKLVVTNYHVIRDQKEVTVCFPRFKGGDLLAEKSAYRDAPKIKAKVIRVDRTHDLALLRLERVPKWATQLKLAAREPGPGERVHSIGHPARSDARFVYSTGFVRQVYRKRWTAVSASGQVRLDSRIVEMGSPINPGDSGGPVLNDRGEVVGVSQGVRFDSLVITYAIAAAEVKAFLAAGQSTSKPVDRAASARR